MACQAAYKVDRIVPKSQSSHRKERFKELHRQNRQDKQEGSSEPFKIHELQFQNCYCYGYPSWTWVSQYIACSFVFNGFVCSACFVQYNLFCSIVSGFVTIFIKLNSLFSFFILLSKLMWVLEAYLRSLFLPFIFLFHHLWQQCSKQNLSYH